MISGGDADHVGVANLAALHNFYDGHARAQFAGLRRHAQDAHVGFFQRVQYFRRGFAHRARTKIFQQECVVFGAAIFQRRRQAGGYRLAHFVGDQCHAFAGADGEAGFDGVFGAGHQFGFCAAEGTSHCLYFIEFMAWS